MLADSETPALLEARRHDRRKNSRGGRRSSDPRANWRHRVWLFCGYAFYLGVRSLASGKTRLFNRQTTQWIGRRG